MRSITITLEDEVASFIELRAAIDDLRLDEAVTRLVNDITVDAMKRKKKVRS